MKQYYSSICGIITHAGFTQENISCTDETVSFRNGFAGMTGRILKAALMPCAFGAFLVVGIAMFSQPAMQPLPAGFSADRIVIEKPKRRMTLYHGQTAIRVYEVSLGSGGSAPKRREGDRLTPEGRYTISGRNPDSAYHLSLRISYPEAADRKRAAEAGVPPGGDIMIHGLRNGFGWLGVLHRMANWTQGCIALTNPEMEEVWRLVPDGTPVEIKG